MRRRAKVLAMATLLSVGGAYALASWNWCPHSEELQPKIISGSSSDGGTFEAGAAQVEISPPYPVVAAGYGPSRPDVSSTHHPLYARAVVLREGSLSFAMVSADVLLIPDEVAREVRQESA